MARLCWTPFVLVVFLSAQISEAAVNTVELTELVKQLLKEYKPPPRNNNDDPPMFALAISIPLNAQKKVYDFQRVISADPPKNVKKALDKSQVYTGTRVVGATVKWSDGLVKFTEHAEYRVFEKFDTLVNKINKDSKKTDLMLFYTFKSPCDEKCANPDPNKRFSILKKMTNIREWANYALVFSKIFVPKGKEQDIVKLEPNRRQALLEIGKVINLSNIYRCTEGNTQCMSCDADGGVNNNCINP